MREAGGGAWSGEALSGGAWSGGLEGCGRERARQPPGDSGSPIAALPPGQVDVRRPNASKLDGVFLKFFLDIFP